MNVQASDLITNEQQTVLPSGRNAASVDVPWQSDLSSRKVTGKIKTELKVWYVVETGK